MPFPWLPGLRVTAARLNEHAPVTTIKSTTTDRASTTTATPDPELAVTLAPGTWEVTLKICYAAAGGQGIKVSWGLSGGMSLAGFRMCAGPDASSTNRNSTLSKWVNTTAGAEVQYGAAAQFSYFEEWAPVTVTSTGPLTVNWAQITSAAGAGSVGQGSYIRAIRIA